MQLTRPPMRELRPFVRQVWAWTPGGDATSADRPGAREHVLPTGAMHLVFRLSGPPLVLFDGGTDARGRSIGHAIVGGARSSFYVRDVSVAAGSVGALLRPGAARVLLGAPEGALAECHTPLDALWGAAATREALERLHAAGDPSRQLAVFEALLWARVLRACSNGLPTLHPAVAAAIAPLAQPQTAIGPLAERSGYSHRHFIALFRAATGLAPKTYARVMRFNRALALAADGARPWAEIALESGYADQAHLGREFPTLAGMAPQNWRRSGADSPRHVPVPLIGATGQIRSRPPR